MTIGNTVIALIYVVCCFRYEPCPVSPTTGGYPATRRQIRNRLMGDSFYCWLHGLFMLKTGLIGFQRGPQEHAFKSSPLQSKCSLVTALF